MDKDLLNAAKEITIASIQRQNQFLCLSSESNALENADVISGFMCEIYKGLTKIKDES